MIPFTNSKLKQSFLSTQIYINTFDESHISGVNFNITLNLFEVNLENSNIHLRTSCHSLATPSSIEICQCNTTYLNDISLSGFVNFTTFNSSTFNISINPLVYVNSKDELTFTEGSDFLKFKLDFLNVTLLNYDQFLPETLTNPVSTIVLNDSPITETNSPDHRIVDSEKLTGGESDSDVPESKGDRPKEISVLKVLVLIISALFITFSISSIVFVARKRKARRSRVKFSKMMNYVDYIGRLHRIH
ncbi:hypothetical protein RF11_14363 [Thelohanellus kitauei]|uniref:Uncharacterized protein n=1 Tax=Thelohanellus kitauei TaxID=669202 RepID=A0A0C2N2R7_THEKT|nr:hypothetical protein RF11_14363 [Thelohanellus kitauei]